MCNSFTAKNLNDYCGFHIVACVKWLWRTRTLKFEVLCVVCGIDQKTWWICGTIYINSFTRKIQRNINGTHTIAYRTHTHKIWSGGYLSNRKLLLLLIFFCCFPFKFALAELLVLFFFPFFRKSLIHDLIVSELIEKWKTNIDIVIEYKKLKTRKKANHLTLCYCESIFRTNEPHAQTK